MRTTHLELGNWNVICDRCGFKLKASKLQEEPRTGLMVCSKCWESWHPQEVLRPMPDQQPLPWTRPEPADQYISITFSGDEFCSPTGLLSQADYASAGCWIVGNVNGGLVP